MQPDVVAVGTRRAGRNEQDAVAPVDNTQLLNDVIPSFNSNRETSADGADRIDSFNLRGMGIDQVLVSGQRRHSLALITFFGSRGPQRV